MNFNQFQKFIPKNGERIIFVEEGSPRSVLISFEDYQKMSATKENNQEGSREEREEQPEEKVAESRDKSLQQSENEVAPKEGFNMQGQEKTELTLDDLPF